MPSSNVVIVTNSDIYLPYDIQKPENVLILPFTIHLEGKEFREGVDIEADEFYARLSGCKCLPTTSQITSNTFCQVFESLLAEGHEILVLPISAKLSSTYESALQAQREMNDTRIEILDTQLVSMPLGFQVLTASKAAADGASLKECKEIAVDAYNHIGEYFMVDTLEFLHRGGRIGGAERLLGAALNIKPILSICEGQVEPVAKELTRSRAFSRMLKLAEAQIAGRRPLQIAVLHASAPEAGQEFKEQAEQYLHPDQIYLSKISPVIGVYTGPGCISIAFMAGKP